MSRRAKKQHSARAALSGTRSSQRNQQRRKAKPLLVVAAAPGAVEPTPGRAPVRLLPAAAKLAAEPPFPDEALADVELAFFEGGSASAPDVPTIDAAELSPLITDDVDSLLLTSEQQQRRQWFRRRVTALMAVMGAFGAVSIAVRIASLL
jgi:hypothetical protein